MQDEIIKSMDICNIPEMPRNMEALACRRGAFEYITSILDGKNIAYKAWKVNGEDLYYIIKEIPFTLHMLMYDTWLDGAEVEDISDFAGNHEHTKVLTAKGKRHERMAADSGNMLERGNPYAYAYIVIWYTCGEEHCVFGSNCTDIKITCNKVETHMHGGTADPHHVYETIYFPILPANAVALEPKNTKNTCINT